MEAKKKLINAAVAASQLRPMQLVSNFRTFAWKNNSGTSNYGYNNDNEDS